MVHTEVSNLDIENTAICVPDTPEFQQWLMGISFFGDSGMTCGEEPPVLPGQVTGVTVTPEVPETVGIVERGGRCRRIQVQWKSGALDFASTRQHTVPSGSTTTYTIPNLIAGTLYTIRVIAIVSNADDGLPSSEILATPKATTPGQVTGVTVRPKSRDCRYRGTRWQMPTDTKCSGNRAPWTCQHTPAHRPLRKHYNLHDPEPHRRHAVHDKSDSDCLQRRRRTAVRRSDRQTATTTTTPPAATTTTTTAATTTTTATIYHRTGAAARGPRPGDGSRGNRRTEAAFGLMGGVSGCKRIQGPVEIGRPGL